MTRLRKILSSYTGSKAVKHTGAGNSIKETLAEEYERSKKEDNVNHPSHYTQGSIECIDAIAEATKFLRGIEATDTGNILKYMWRWNNKNGLEDLRKARWYLNHLISHVEENQS
jgi:hypothetical protein